MRDFAKIFISICASSLFSINANAAETNKPTIFYNKVGAALKKDKPEFFYNKVGAALSRDKKDLKEQKPATVVALPNAKKTISVNETPKKPQQIESSRPKDPDIYSQKPKPITKIAKPTPKQVEHKIDYLEVKAQTDEAIANDEPTTGILYDILNDGQSRDKIKSKKL